MKNHTSPAISALRRQRALKLAGAHGRGVSDGLASVLRLGQSAGKPATARVRRDEGSLEDDAVAIRRDGERLFG